MLTTTHPESTDTAVRRAQDQLQGKWDFYAGRWPAQLSFVGARFTVHFRNGDTYRGTYSVDPSRSPGIMDMTVDEGPEPYVGLVALCLYELDGDELRWCPAEPGATARRTAFPIEEGCRFPTLVFRRHVNQPLEAPRNLEFFF
jgi:uncharacterized protein (TIGR03067 family)